MLEIEYSKQAQRFLKKIKKTNLQIAKSIVSKILDLQVEPLPLTSKTIINHSPYRRVKIDKYRIVYCFNEKILNIDLIEKRDKVYKELNKL